MSKELSRLEREIIETSGNKAIMQELCGRITLNRDLEAVSHTINNECDFDYDINDLSDDEDEYYDYGDGRNPVTLAAYSTMTRLAYSYPEFYDLINFVMQVNDCDLSTDEYFYENEVVRFAPKSVEDFKNYIEEEFGVEYDYLVAELERQHDMTSCCRNLVRVLESFEKNFKFVPNVAPQISAGIYALYGSPEDKSALSALNVQLKGGLYDLDGNLMSFDKCIQRFDRKAVSPIADCGNNAFITLAAFGYVNPNGMPAIAKEAFTHCASMGNLRSLAKISEIFKNIPKNVKQADIVSVLENPNVALKYLEKINGSHQVTIAELAQELRIGFMEQEKYKFEQEYGLDFSNNYINIKGAENVIEMAGMKAYILPANDLRNFTVGYDTYCCQHFGGVGESCVAAAVDRDNTGIFVIEKNGKIEAQAFVWTHGHSNDDGSFVFDSITFDNIEFANDQNLNRHDDIIKGYKEGMSVDEYEDLKKTIAFEGIISAYVENLPYDNVYMGTGYNQMGLLGRKIKEEDFVKDIDDWKYKYELPELVEMMTSEAIGMATYTDFSHNARVLKKDGWMCMSPGMEMKMQNGMMVAVDELQYHLGKQDLRNPEINVYEKANVVGLTMYKGDTKFILEVADGSKQILADDLSKFNEIAFDESMMKYDTLCSRTSLKNVQLPEDLIFLSSTFNGARFCGELELPNSLQTIGKLAFANTAGLVELTIPESVKEIQERAFENSMDLRTIWLPDNLEYIAPNCFEMMEYVSMSDSICKDGVPDRIFDNYVSIDRMYIKDTCGKANEMAYKLLKEGCVDEIELDHCNQITISKDEVKNLSFKDFEKKFFNKNNRSADLER